MLISPASAIAEEPRALPFLEVASSYILVYSTTSEPLPGYVKILASGGGQWFRVEYTKRFSRQQVGKEPKDEVQTFQMWLNFATVVGVTENPRPKIK